MGKKLLSKYKRGQDYTCPLNYKKDWLTTFTKESEVYTIRRNLDRLRKFFDGMYLETNTLFFNTQRKNSIYYIKRDTITALEHMIQSENYSKGLESIKNSEYINPRRIK